MTALSSERIPVVLVGAGHMGRIHAHRIQSSSELALVAVVDPDRERGESLAEQLQLPWSRHYEDVLMGAAAAIVAAPTSLHHSIANDLVAAGLDILVEKPLAAHLSDAESMASRAKCLGRVLQVGHVEWFNPAFEAARSRIDRAGYFCFRRESCLRLSTTDVDVVWDLMIHDLHILLELVGEEPVRIEASGRRVECETTDVAEVRLEFANGAIAELHANRVSCRRVRTMEIKQDNEALYLDFIARRAFVSAEESKSSDEWIELWVAERDAVEAEHAAFAHAILCRSAGAVSAERVLAAIRTATRVSELLPSRCAPVSANS